jgi:hypothetical protein
VTSPALLEKPAILGHFFQDPVTVQKNAQSETVKAETATVTPSTRSTHRGLRATLAAPWKQHDAGLIGSGEADRSLEGNPWRR